MLRKLVDWLESRTGVETAVKDFLYEEIPASAGWHQVFGSIALFCFLTQAFTGVLLALNYAPTPGEAYYSVRYIMTELTGGPLIRGLHHWGASMMIVVIVLHMVQVFLWGAYKKPREATWMVGVVLLLLTLAYGLTGYLLPWDNRAYWGTVVATQIGAKAPLLGEYVSRLMGVSDGQIGAVTFSRFYALHVLLLPPATMLLIAVHVFLVRKHGVAPAPDDSKPKKKFYPEQVFKDTIAIFATFAILFLLAVAARAPLGRMADPTDTSYIPRPDWYFLFLFQLLKLFEGPLEVIGSVVLPGMAVMALFLVPFIDRGKMVKVRQRTTAAGVVVLAGLGWGGLTAAALMTTPATSDDIFDLAGPEPWQQLPPENLAAFGHFRKADCASCHTLGEGGSKAGPDLAKTTSKPKEWLTAHFKEHGREEWHGGHLNMLAGFFREASPETAKALWSAPGYAPEGAMIYQEHRCGTCHVANGSGSKMGPPLNGLASRRSREWVEGHFIEPQKYSPGTMMPEYKLSSRDLNRLTSYLFALPN